MDNNNLPSDSTGIISQIHQQVTQTTDNAEKSLSTLTTSPARSTWSPVGTPRSTSTAYSNTSLNATAMDFSTRTGISPMSFSPASDGMRTAVGNTPARRRSPNRGSVLTQDTRSRPNVRRSDIIANIQRHHLEDGIETARSASPMTAYSPGGLSANTARPISGTPRSNLLTPVPLPDGGVLSPATGLWRTGITPEGRTPGRSFQSRKSSKATKTAVGTASVKSTKTALGKSPMVGSSGKAVARTPGTPGGRPRSTITAILPGTPGSRFEKGNFSTKSTKTAKAATGTPGGLQNSARTPGGPDMEKSAKSTKTALGTPGGALSRTPATGPRSTITAVPPGTPGNFSQRSSKSVKSTKTAIDGTPGGRLNSTPRTPGGPASEKSAKSTKTALGTPGGALSRTPASAPRSTITAIPPGTPGNLSQRSGKSIKSTKTAIDGTPGGRLNSTPRTPGGPASEKSAKSTKTAFLPTPKSVVPGRTPYNTPVSAVTPGSRGLSQRSVNSTKTAVMSIPRNQRSDQRSENSVEIPVCRTPMVNTPRRPVESKRNLRKTPTPNKAKDVASTTTAITPNGASAVTARSLPPTRMNTAWTPGTPITLGSSLSPDTRTARLLSAPLTPYKGLKAARSGPRSSSISESISSSSEKNMRTAKGSRSQDKTLEVSSGRNYQNVPDSPPLIIVETTSFSRTPTRSAATSATNTAISPAVNNVSWKSPKKDARSTATAITPGGLSARTARPISEKTPKSGRKSTITAITPGYLSARTARSMFTPVTAKPNTENSARSGGQQASNSSLGGARKSLLPKDEKSIRSRRITKTVVTSVKKIKSVRKVSRKSKSQGVSKKSAASTKSFTSGAPSTASEIEQEILDEAKNKHKVIMTSALPDGSFKVVVQLSVRAAGTGGRVNLAGKAPEGMITKKISVNGAEVYEA